jgi:hypothetical protein
MAASEPIGDVGHLKMEKGEKNLFEKRRATKKFQKREFRGARPTI